MLTGTRKAFKVNWRFCWYSALVWLFVVLVESFIVLPWYYLVLPLAILIPTVMFFRFPKKEIASYAEPGKLFAVGLWLGGTWCLSIFILDFVEFIGFDFDNMFVYFQDSRNFLKIGTEVDLKI
ncbi:hypothetical protein HY024_02590 [Candidatus Curtissbacteria bacterium]|nr:hypothetical protein [Candidatus Curtissbacteria bacterium]